MRYKEQVLNNLDRVKNILRTIEVKINTNETRDEVLKVLSTAVERVEQAESLVNIEKSDF